jgi:iron complex outermembrane receptor protein
MDNRLRLNGAVFFNDYKDIILNLSNCTAQTGSPATGVPCALPANVGTAEVWGAELEASLRLGGGISVDATASVLDFKYTDTGVATGVTTDMITPFTPEQKYSLGVMWEGDIGNGATLLARADASYQSAIQSAAINLSTDINPFNSNATHVPGYTVVNARITWRGAEDLWEASLEVNNILDKLYFFGGADWSTNAGSTTYTPALPRNWAVTLKRNFN